MFDDIQDNQQEVVQPEVMEVEQEEIKTAPKTQSKNTDQEYNFNLLRERSERIQRERDEAIYRLQQLEAEKNNQASESIEEDINIAPDDIAEGKHISKLTKQIRNLESKLHANQRVNEKLSTESKLRSQYPDFDKVVCSDNISAFQQMHPDLAESIGASKDLNNPKDLYSAAVLTYKLIKQFGIGQEQQFSQEHVLAHKNNLKPKPLASINPQQADSPLSNANAFASGLTPDLQKSLLAEMNKYRKNF